MPNVSGRAGTLTVLTPILPGHEEALSDYLLNLRQRDESPFVRLEETHFARWVIIDKQGHEAGSGQREVLKSRYLLFTALIDGTPDRYFERLCAVMGPEADAIWSHCAGYPGTQDPAAFKVYFKHNQIDATLFFAAYPQASRLDVLRSLRLREQLIDFAVTHQGLQAEPLHKAYLEAFGEGLSI
jgi:hypothetical protein